MQQPLAERILPAMRQAQQSYRFHLARALAAPLLAINDDPALFVPQRDGLFLAHQLALVEADFLEARRWGEALARLHGLQSDPDLRRGVYAEPLRQWRLEFGACAAAAEQAQILLKQEPQEALLPLLMALEGEPQSTALVYALLLVLRRGGWLELSALTAEPSTPGLIPAKLWLLRRHGEATTALEQRQARWQELHPGWQLHWLDHQREAIASISGLPELVHQCCLCLGDGAVRGDLLRLAMLWQHGGVAVDGGIAPLQSLQPLLAGSELLLLQDRLGGIDGSVVAAPPHHPWVEAALVQACRNVIEGQGYSRWDLSGSCLLSGVTARWLRPQLATQLPTQLPPIVILAPAEQGAWLQFGAAEPAPEGFVAPAAEPLLNRRLCSSLQRQWGQELPPLALATSWSRLAVAAGQPELAPPDLAAFLLQQPSPPLTEQLQSLLAHPPSWRQLFPLHSAAAGRPVEEPPAADVVQQAEQQRQGDLQQMSFDWLPLAGQFHHTLAAICQAGRQPWIVDAGTHSGRSARWLAQRWPEAQLLCLVQRQADLPLVADQLAGSQASWLEAWRQLRFPLERLQAWLAARGGEPLLLHLDAGMDSFGELFAGGGEWLACFPLVLLHGALACDSQGRLLSQPHQQALAAAGFEVVRSGEVLVAFQRRLLRPAPFASAFAAAAELPSLNGTPRQQGGVVAFDGEWQSPAITEQRACELALQRLGEHPDAVYVGFPWASLIDHLNCGTDRGRALLAQLQALVPLLEGRRRRVTVCQQIFFEQHRWLFELAGITDLFWPHATIHSSVPGLAIHPFPLFPVQWQAPGQQAHPSRDILYSFIGARSTQLYLSNSRDLILSSLHGLPGSLIEGYDGWYFDDLVYGLQIFGRLKADDPQLVGEERHLRQRRYVEVMQRSLFALCPSGTGPNTIRLWEAMGCGAIPVVLSDRWRPPGPRQLWEQAVLFLPDTPEGVMGVPRLTAQWSTDPQLLADKRVAMAELWRRYGPDSFISDIEALWSLP